MKLLNPKDETFDHLDNESAQIMRKTVAFFEEKGKARIKEDYHNKVWYQDFLDFVARQKIFATLFTPTGYGPLHSCWNYARISAFNEILGFYGLPYWYTQQVTMLGLGPIWMSPNEKAKQKAARLLKEGEVFAFGLSEKEHGADIIASEMRLSPNGDGGFVANGSKYYIGNGNKARMVSTFGKIEGSGKYVFFSVDSQHKNFELLENVVASQNYVSSFRLNDYPISEDDILETGREAWDASLSTVAFCKYNLGWAAVGMCTHSFYEAIRHASGRTLFRHKVTDFPHIQSLLTEAYCRVSAMRIFARRACDYMRTASEHDKRYLLYNPIVKMKVTMQGEKVMELLSDVIAAKGFEKSMYFEMAGTEIRGLPRLEGTVHVNMLLALQFLESYFFESVEMPYVGRINESSNDTFLFAQGATSKGLKNARVHDYRPIFESKPLPCIGVFQKQIDLFQRLVSEPGFTAEQRKDLSFMLNVGEIFSLIVYGQLILEGTQFDGVEDDFLDFLFGYFVKDFGHFALRIYGHEQADPSQRDVCLKIIQLTQTSAGGPGHIWEKYVYPLREGYEMPVVERASRQ